jgi:hypothetical protein
MDGDFERIRNSLQSFERRNRASVFQPGNPATRQSAPPLQVGLREILGFALRTDHGADVNPQRSILGLLFI